MNDNDKGLIIMWSVISGIAFIFGFGIGNPNYQFSENVRNRLKQDTINNYRSEHEQIRFIIHSYYSDHKDVKKQKED